MKKVIILGQYGNLAKSLQRIYPLAKLVGRDEYLSWMTNPKLLEEVIVREKQDSQKIEIDILNCVGVINPSTHSEIIEKVNCALPVFLSNQSINLEYRLITFGTVMENRPQYAATNRYLQSKLKFSEVFNSTDEWKRQNIHFQLHTLYGGDHIQDALFLGQVYNSLRARKPFFMGSGKQLREYHHIDDISSIVARYLLNRNAGVKVISHGYPLELGVLAREIFLSFGVPELLNLNSIATSEFDNLNEFMPRSDEYRHIAPRNPLVDIVNWFITLGVRNEK
jgi:hypothetical protein